MHTATLSLAQALRINTLSTKPMYACISSTATEYTQPNVFLYLEYNDVHDTGDSCLEAGAAATEHIRIGPCLLHWSQVSNLELGVLRNLHHEIQDRSRMPVSFERFFARVEALVRCVAAVQNATDATKHSYCQDDGIVTQSRSWSGAIEAIARCVAAFKNATDAAEHGQCNEMAVKLCSYATALAQRTSPYVREHFLAVLYEYIQNRTYDLALKKVLVDIEAGFWWRLSERQRSKCCTLLEICITAGTHHEQALQHKMASCRLS
jgi:hypothetical protein